MNQQDTDYQKRRDFLLAMMKKQTDAEMRRAEPDEKKHFGKTTKARNYGSNIKTYAPKRYKK
jgi:hypothetical protein